MSKEKKRSALAAMMALATDVGRLKAEGKEIEAREAQAQLGQLMVKASRTTAKYDVWTYYVEKIERFGTSRARWQQAKRSVHADRGGMRSSKVLAKEFEKIWADGQAEGKSTEDLLGSLAIHAVCTASDHDVAVRDEISKLQNLDECAALVEAAGSVEAAKDLAKESGVKWAKVYGAEPDGEQPDEDDAHVNVNGASAIAAEVSP